MPGQPSQNFPFPPEQPSQPPPQPPPQVVYYVQQPPQYRPEDYVRAYRRDEGNRNALGCFLAIGTVLACAAAMVIASQGL